MPHYRGAQNELIFVNNQAETSKFAKPEPQAAENNPQDDEQVDLEIIILGPKRGDKRRTRKNKLRRVRSDPTHSTETIDDQDAKSSPDSPSERDPEADKASGVSPKVNEGLLKQLEKRYGRKVLKPDDDTYVDYLDYF